MGHPLRLEGVWAALPTPWDRAGAFDAGLLRENVNRLATAGVHGMYTTDSAGEFYALEYDEFRAVVTAFAREVEGLPIAAAVGCHWINTEGVLRRVRLVSELGIPFAKVTTPFWKPLNQTSLRRFWHEVSAAVPDVGLVHYNTEFSKTYHTGSDYRWLAENIPNFVATKLTKNDTEAFLEVRRAAPMARHFVIDSFMGPGLLLGAAGVHSSLVNMSPRPVLELYDRAACGDLPAVLDRHRCMSDFIAEVIAPVVAKGYRFATIDKALYEAGGFLVGSRCTRPPYEPVSDQDVTLIRSLTAERYPEFIHRW